MVDRKKLKNPNGLILGTPGSGKSFSAKREIANAFLTTDDDIIISDPESEYSPLVERLNGQVIRIAPTSDQYINPMDINMNYSEDDNPIALKADFILSLCELIVGHKEGLQPVEKTVIDRCIRQIYQQYFENPTPENMPILQDLYDALLTQDEPEAHHVAKALEIYVSGSLNVFNHRTNVELQNRLVCFDIKDLGKQLKKIGMLAVQDQVWGRVSANRNEGRSTRYYMDEAHLLLKEDQTAAYTVEIWKRFRKWGGIPTAITQNVKDFLASKEVESIFENTDFVIMLNQAVGDRAILAKQLNVDKKLEERNHGIVFTVSPWALTWDDENYYLVAFDDYDQKIKHYRVDKMKQIELLEEKRDGKEEFKGFDMAAYSKMNFGMYSGRKEKVKIEFNNYMVGVFIDRFGKDISIVPIDDKNSYTHVDVAISPQFFAWILSLGDEVKITGPEKIVEEMKEYVQEFLDRYK